MIGCPLTSTQHADRVHAGRSWGTTQKLGFHRHQTTTGPIVLSKRRPLLARLRLTNGNKLSPRIFQKFSQYEVRWLTICEMGSNLRRLRRDFTVPVASKPTTSGRVDKPEMVLEIAALREKNNHMAARAGLPAIGSKLVNRHGLEFVVESHVHVPTANSAQRLRDGSQLDADLYPSIIPQNMSEKLAGFVAAVDRCTMKTLLVLDTMPHARRDAGVPDGHWVDTIGNAGANLLFIDAAQIHETHFAHEIGHLWIQYVEQAEDERVLEDVSDAGRLHQLSFVQSFVTDLRVNQIIARRGFDVSLIARDQALSVASLGRALDAGYRPENPREGVFMALALAAQLVEERTSGGSTLAKLDDTLQKVTGVDPDLAQLVMGFASAVERHGYQDRDQIRASIDDCLKLAFDYSGDGIDLERDLVIPLTPEPEFDKNPQWLAGASPELKCEVGRIMAREGIPEGSQWSIADGPMNNRFLSFELPDGTFHGSWPLEHSQDFVTQNGTVQRINELNRESRERQMKPERTHGMPNFPGQPRRFYMAGTARFLTAVREAEWLGGEHPYGYALNNPVMYTDPSGNLPQIIGCGSGARKFLQKVCKYVNSHIGEDIRTRRINRCISTFAYRAGTPCPSLTPDKVKCFQGWCASGRIECYKRSGIPGRPDSGGYAGAPGCVQISPGGSPFDMSGKDNSMTASDYLQPHIGPYDGEKDGYSYSLLSLTMLHEIGHKCDVWHGKEGDEHAFTQCNDIWAFCIYRSIWGSRNE